MTHTARGQLGPAAGAGEPQIGDVRWAPGDRRLLNRLAHSPAASASPPVSATPDPFEPHHPCLEDWVVDYFAPMFGRPLTSTVRWCSQWWDHAEAISRLEALWRSWEVSRLDGLRGMAIWHRDFLDTLLPVLLSATGPFARCTADRHTPNDVLPTMPAPDGYWDADETVRPNQTGRTGDGVGGGADRH